MNWYQCPKTNKQGLFMKVAIASKQEMIDFFQLYAENTALIEIVNDGKSAAEFYGGHYARKLTLSFSDGIEATAPKSFKPEQAQRIVEFIQSLEDHIDKVIVSCTLGQSRSAGIAAALITYYGENDQRIWSDPNFSPNPLCYRLLQEAFSLAP